MEKKRQRFKNGAIVNINLSSDRIAFGRLIGTTIAIYDYIVAKTVIISSIEIIISKPILFYVSIYKDVILKGEFKILGVVALTDEDIVKTPPKFHQDIMDINDCTIFYPEDRLPERKATPQECLRLERSAVWDDYNIVDRIEDYYAGRKNVSVELFRPILSTNDIRYNSAGLIRWDFEKEEFYKVTEEQIKEDFKNGKIN